jgi:putative hemolysin
LAFLEDALEEIVGPLGDEFDEAETDVQRRPDGSIEMIGELALPEAATELGLTDLPDDTDTIGGYIVAELGRLPRAGDEVQLGRYQVKVTHVERNRIAKLVFFKASPDTEAPPAEPGDEDSRKD